MNVMHSSNARILALATLGLSIAACGQQSRNAEDLGSLRSTSDTAQSPISAAHGHHDAVAPSTLPTYAFFESTTVDPTNPDAQAMLTIQLSTDPDFCAKVQKHEYARNSAFVTIELKEYFARPMDVRKWQGTYAIPTEAFAAVIKLDDQCRPSMETATMGSLDLASVNTEVLKGSLHTNEGSIAFRAMSCPGLSSKDPYTCI